MTQNENFIYLADNRNCPYGSKSKKEILSLSDKNCEKLIEFNCKIIIIACNTSTTNSIQKLREMISLPIVGIEPGLKPAINYTKTKGILGLIDRLIFEFIDRLETEIVKKKDKFKNFFLEHPISKFEVQK